MIEEEGRAGAFLLDASALDGYLLRRGITSNLANQKYVNISSQ